MPKGDKPRSTQPSSSESSETRPVHLGEPPSIPDHELLKRIGRGAYGEVWLARNIMGNFRAVKVVYKDTFEHERPYEREFKGIQQFEPVSRKHPSQVDVLHIGRNDDKGYFYYVMEIADDSSDQSVQRPDDRTNSTVPNPQPSIHPDAYRPHTLKFELHERRRLPFEKCMQIALGLTTALENLHGNGLVHRDIKPSNIIFVDGIPKLADIGLVSTVDATMSMVGTPGYMPLDGANGPKSDIYALGKVLYEISMDMNRTEFPTLPEGFGDFPDHKQLLEFNSILVKACQSDPKKRYHSAADMGADLLLLQSGKSIKRLHWLEQRQRTFIKTTMIGTLATILALAGFFYEWQQREKIAALAMDNQHNLYAADMDLASRAFRDGDLGYTRELLEKHRPPPDGSPGDSVDLRGWEWRYLWNRCQGDERFTLFRYPESVTTLNISRDGKWLALRRAGGRVALWDAVEKRRLAEFAGVGWAAKSMALSPQGSLLAYATKGEGGDTVVEVLDVATQKSIDHLKPDGVVLSLSFSPDSSLLAMLTANTSQGNVQVWDWENRQVITSFPTSGISFSHYGEVCFSPDGRVLALGETEPRIRLLEWETGRERVLPLLPPNNGVSALAYSPDGRFLAASGGYSDNRVHLWDLATGEESQLMGHNIWIVALAFSPDSKTLASAGSDQTIRLWSLSQTVEPAGPTKRTAEARSDKISTSTVAPPQSLFADEDGDVERSRAMKIQPLGTLHGHEHAVLALAFSADGNDLVSGGQDG